MAQPAVTPEPADRRWVRQGGWSDEQDARIAPFDAAAIDVGGLFPPAAP